MKPRFATRSSACDAAAAIGRARLPIDIVAALDLLDQCVRERGHAYSRAELKFSRPALSGRYRGFVRPDGIVGHALKLAGVGLPTALAKGSYVCPTATADHGGTTSHSGTTTDKRTTGYWDLSPLTVGASVVFRAAESTELDGGSWGESRALALATAARFVDVIPAAQHVASLDDGQRDAVQDALAVWLSRTAENGSTQQWPN